MKAGGFSYAPNRPDTNYSRPHAQVLSHAPDSFFFSFAELSCEQDTWTGDAMCRLDSTCDNSYACISDNCPYDATKQRSSYTYPPSGSDKYN